MLATERKVSVSTHRQALSALLFLYREVFAQDLPWLQDIGRPVAARRIPSVLSVPEIERLLGLMDGQPGLLARLLYVTLTQFPYRSEVGTSGSSGIAVADGSRQRRANSAGVAQSQWNTVANVHPPDLANHVHGNHLVCPA
jgi:hypothetical protein